MKYGYLKMIYLSSFSITSFFLRMLERRDMFIGTRPLYKKTGY